MIKSRRKCQHRLTKVFTKTSKQTQVRQKGTGVQKALEEEDETSEVECNISTDKEISRLSRKCKWI